MDATVWHAINFSEEGLCPVNVILHFGRKSLAILDRSLNLFCHLSVQANKFDLVVTETGRAAIPLVTVGRRFARWAALNDLGLGDAQRVHAILPWEGHVLQNGALISTSCSC